MTIADRISELRKGRELSQEELAEMTGVSRQAVSKWESEQSVPEMDKIITLSEIFGVTTDYLLKGIEPLEARPERRNKPAKAYNIVATALSAIGVVLGAAMYETEPVPGALIAFVFMTLGIMVFMLGTTRISRKDQPSNGCRFWRINIWIVAFFVLSVIYNLAVQGKVAAFPMSIPNRSYVDMIVWADFDGDGAEEQYFYEDGIYRTYQNEVMKKMQEERAKYESYPDWLKKGGGAAIFIVTYMVICASTTYILTRKDEKERLKRAAE